MTDAVVTEQTVRLGGLARSLGFQLRMAQLQVFDMFYRHLAPQGLKPGEFTVLWVIGENPGLRQGTIARELRIRPAHMTKLIQRMVAAGFVMRKVPKDDRRSVQLSLTAAGSGFVRANAAAFANLQVAERGCLSKGEAAQLLALLAKLTGIGDDA